eukprot:IDg8871t1
MQAMNQSFQQYVGALYDQAGGKTPTRTVSRTAQIGGQGWDIGKIEDVHDIPDHSSTGQKERLHWKLMRQQDSRIGRKSRHNKKEEAKSYTK